ncbi:hypothetical protein [Yoonia sp.]|uniref:hypothetical protein n=1 Tax=Yoonia sp. TaxID=2212373 RepID=UPI00358EA13F
MADANTDVGRSAGPIETEVQNQHTKIERLAFDNDFLSKYEWQVRTPQNGYLKIPQNWHGCGKKAQWSC